jgi:hypothetical protein
LPLYYRLHYVALVFQQAEINRLKCRNTALCHTL